MVCFLREGHIFQHFISFKILTTINNMANSLVCATECILVLRVGIMSGIRDNPLYHYTHKQMKH